MRDFKGIWIPKDVWLNDKLSMTEKMFFVEIDSLDNDDGCYASNAHFASFFNLSKNRCSEIIKGLKAKKLIKVTTFRNEKRVLCRVIKAIKNQNLSTDLSTDTGKKGVVGNSTGVVGNSTGVVGNSTGVVGNSTDTNINTIINTVINPLNPPWLDTSAWTEFVQHRKDIRKPLTVLSVKKNIAVLEKHKTQQREIIDTSIANRWTGLFPLKGGSSGTGQGNRKPSLAERATTAREEYEQQFCSGQDDGKSVGEDESHLRPRLVID